MNTQNEFGRDAGRYIYRTMENRDARAGQLSVYDLKTGTSKVLAERVDWEAFDGIVWTPWGTILANEEVTRSRKPDPQVPQAKAGLVYEFFIDPNDPSRLDPSREPMTAPGDGTTDTTQDGIRVRPAIGSKAHEGMRFDKQGNLYGIAESRGRTTTGASGGIFRFVPDRAGDLSSGRLQAFASPNRQDGAGRWIDLDRTQVQIDADAEAEAKGANEYQRPEDIETGQSTGKDRNNGGNTLYVSLTEGDDEGVLAIDLTKPDAPFAYDYVGQQAGNASTATGFSSPDNLALDSKGNLVVMEDPGGTPPKKTQGDDYFVAAPPEGGTHQPARTVQRFASLKDCIAEPSGPYFALEGTEKFARQNPDPAVAALVGDKTLFGHRQHAGQTSALDRPGRDLPSRPGRCPRQRLSEAELRGHSAADHFRRGAAPLRCCSPPVVLARGDAGRSPAVHHLRWHVHLGDDGHPWFTPPPWTDPTQTPRPAHTQGPAPPTPHMAA